MTLRIAIVLSLLSSASSILASDQPTGSRIRDGQPAAMVRSWGYIEPTAAEIKSVPQAKTAFLARKLARCIVSKNSAAAAVFLELPESDLRYKDVSQKIVGLLEWCMENSAELSQISSVRFPPLTLRGYLAEAFLRSWAKPTLPIITSVRESYASTWMSSTPEQAVVEEMSLCIAETHPTETIQVIGSKPMSLDEKQAMEAIMPFVPVCLGKGATLKTNATGLRLALALGLYHRVVGPKTMNPSPTVGKPS